MQEKTNKILMGKVTISAGYLKHYELSVNPKITRPTKALVKESVFEILRSELLGSRFLDLFAGSGQMGFQALSLGAQEATFFESCPEAARAIQSFGKKHALNFTMFSQDAEQGLQTLLDLKKSVDLAFVDPPYCFWDKESFDRILQKLHPVVTRMAIIEMGSATPLLKRLLTSRKKVPKEGIIIDSWRLVKLYRYGDSTLLKLLPL